MLALVAAILFAIALIVELISYSSASLPEILITAGLLCAALYLAGIGARSWRR
jgi:hypothetical protein